MSLFPDYTLYVGNTLNGSNVTSINVHDVDYVVKNSDSARLVRRKLLHLVWIQVGPAAGMRFTILNKFLLKNLANFLLALLLGFHPLACPLTWQYIPDDSRAIHQFYSTHPAIHYIIDEILMTDWWIPFLFSLMTSSIFSEVGVGGMTLTFEFIADDGEREPEEEVDSEDEDGWKKMLVSNLKMLFNNLTSFTRFS
jgi:hypothetical protein